MKCCICGSDTKLLFRDLILRKYEGRYLYCDQCSSINVDSPSWLGEAYTAAIAATDTGIVSRNESLCVALMSLLEKIYLSAPCVLDYGAGYGLMVRMLRDRGVNALWQDRYCDNIFAKGFEYKNGTKIDLVIAFEVVEHLERPMDFFGEAFSLADTIIVSTELIPTGFIESEKKDWWYLSKETGQHIFFYSSNTFYKIANYFSSRYFHFGPFQVLTRDTKTIGFLEGCRSKNMFGPSIAKRALARLKAAARKVSKDSRGSNYRSLTWHDHLYWVERISKEYGEGGKEMDHSMG